MHRKVTLLLTVQGMPSLGSIHPVHVYVYMYVPRILGICTVEIA